MYFGFLQKAASDLRLFVRNIKEKTPFVFVRFSDGETEILLGNRLEIEPGKTFFRGSYQSNKLPIYDSKRFNPDKDIYLREQLILSACHQSGTYFKGIPALHNRMPREKKLMITLNSFSQNNLTFADLFVNSNFVLFEKELVPLLISAKPFVIANFRAKPLFDCTFIPIPDNCFDHINSLVDSVLSDLLEIPAYSLILSSASSLSNIIGFNVVKKRPDLTFIDIGTSMNRYLSLDLGIRNYYSYHQSSPLIRTLKKFKPGYRLIW